MPEPLLQLTDLSVTYQGEHPVHAIRNIDLSVEPGEHIAIMGLLKRQVDEGTTVVLITHDPFVAAAADRTLRIAYGVLQQSP